MMVFLHCVRQHAIYSSVFTFSNSVFRLLSDDLLFSWIWYFCRDDHGDQ
jgi:hypothetical protein